MKKIHIKHIPKCVQDLFIAWTKALTSGLLLGAVFISILNRWETPATSGSALSLTANASEGTLPPRHVAC